MNVNWKSEWPHRVILLGVWITAAISWSGAPDQIPVHWNLAGEADRYGGRFEGILLLPLMALGIYAFLLLIPRIDPGRANYEGFQGPYSTVRILVLAVMAGVYAMTNLSMRGVDVRMNNLMPLLIGMMFLVLGNIMGKLRPNWFTGIRTPWTLSSKRSWSRTHRVGGWVYIVLGLVMLIADLVSSPGHSCCASRWHSGAASDSLSTPMSSGGAIRTRHLRPGHRRPRSSVSAGRSRERSGVDPPQPVLNPVQRLEPGRLDEKRGVGDRSAAEGSLEAFE